MKLRILTAIVAISATGGAATVLDCGEVQTLYQDAECCGDSSSHDTCARSLTVQGGSGLILSNTGELSLSISDGELSIAKTDGLQTALNNKQATITDGALTIAKIDGLQTALDGQATSITANRIDINAGLTGVPDTYMKYGSELPTGRGGEVRLSTGIKIGDSSLTSHELWTALKIETGNLVADGGKVWANKGLGVGLGANIAGGLTVTGIVDTATSLGATHLLYNAGGGDNGYDDTWHTTAKMGSNFYNTAQGQIGISVGEGVVANNYFHNSDQRIKKDITDADTSELLATLNKFSMRKYGYITQGKESETTVGWIAQEVSAVDSSYVNLVSQAIPDIGSIGVIVTTGEGETTVRLTEVAIEVGDKLRVDLSTGSVTVTVTSVDADADLVTFDREIAEEESESGVDANGDEVARVITIYGRVVDDFHTLDKGRLLATAVGAVQELSTRQAALETLNGKFAALEARLAALE